MTDQYVRDIQQKGDAGSKLLATQTDDARSFSKFVETRSRGMHGVSLINPQDYVAVVHSAGGNHHLNDPREYARSVVLELVMQARMVGATPVAMASVIESTDGDLDLLKELSTGMTEVAFDNQVSIVNGENAIHGRRVKRANITGTMTSFVTRDKAAKVLEKGIMYSQGAVYAIFDPKGQMLFMNSDGVGTKTECYELGQLVQIATHDLALIDNGAMKFDDASLHGARVRVSSDVLETRTTPHGAIDHLFMAQQAAKYAREFGVIGTLQHAEVGDRIIGYRPDWPTYNVCGSVVSTIDERWIDNPPRPLAGDYLVAIRAKRSSPRSNGLTDKRDAMEIIGAVLKEKYNTEFWHTTPEGKHFLHFLTTPSLVLYPLFSELLESGVAHAAFHLSGGAYNGKLAKPLAKHGLFASLDNLFEPDERDLQMMKARGTTVSAFYAKCPAGTEGFVATGDVDATMRAVEARGWEGRPIGRLEKAVEKAGVRARTPLGETVEYLYDVEKPS